MLKTKLKENTAVLTIRMTPQQYDQVVKAVQENPLLYGDKSHFCRVAIIREIRRLQNQEVK